MAIVALALVITGCSGGATGHASGPTPSTTSSPVVEQDTVQQLMVGAPDAPVRVVFGRHAAIYLLDRGDPNFAGWLAVLQHAHDAGTPVRFAYDVYGPRLTLVEPAN
ncbi:MAG: hypothetical protein EKK34_01205 [Mycobacterium sp.]|nr:MAG: hypothetical protein EKK34_01205 [Mycobacterium sp.]